VSHLEDLRTFALLRILVAKNIIVKLLPPFPLLLSPLHLLWHHRVDLLFALGIDLSPLLEQHHSLLA
jgi:hypothetical protein